MNQYDKEIIATLKFVDTVNKDMVKRYTELVERATPKKPKKEYEGIGGIPINICPECGWTVNKNRCCDNNNCRQALDWNDKQ